MKKLSMFNKISRHLTSIFFIIAIFVGFGAFTSKAEAAVPTVTTQSATGVSATAATLHGNITATGGSNATVRGFAWGTQSTLVGGDTATTTASGSFGTGPFTGVLSALTCNTTYYSRAYATNTTGTGFGSISAPFTTSPCVPTVTTPTQASVTATTATLGANVTSNGGGTLTARGTCWGTSSAPTGNCVAEGGTTTGVFTQARTGITSGVTIYYRGYATNSAGTAYSSDDSFVTPKANQSTLTLTGLPGSAMYGATTTASTSGGSGTGAVTFSAGESSACSVGSSSGIVTITSGSGTCAITATKAADTNYNVVTSAPVSIAVAKANAALTVSNSPVAYDGSVHAATVSSVVSGSVSNILTGGATSQLNVGTYAVTAGFLPTDTANYNTLTGASAGNFIINKATSTLSVTNSPITYDGSTHAATVSSTVAGVVSSILTGGAANKTNAGTYAVTANFTPSDTSNYNTLTAASAGNFIINKTDQSALIVTGLPSNASYGQGGISAGTSGGTGTGAVTYDAGSSTACSVNASSGVEASNLASTVRCGLHRATLPAARDGSCSMTRGTRWRVSHWAKARFLPMGAERTSG